MENKQISQTFLEMQLLRRVLQGVTHKQPHAAVASRVEGAHLDCPVPAVPAGVLTDGKNSVIDTD